jgi:hypothetical protein
MSLPVNPGEAVISGSLAFPGKRSAGAPPGASDLVYDTGYPSFPTGRNGVIIPNGTTTASPYSSGGLTSDVLRGELGIPSLDSASAIQPDFDTNAFTPYARKTRPFDNSALDAKLFDLGVIQGTMRDPHTTSPTKDPKKEWIDRRYGRRGPSYEEERAKNFLLKRPLGRNYIMMNPTQMNLVFASVEPWLPESKQHLSWTVDKVLKMWNPFDGIVLNEEGSMNVRGTIDDEGKQRLINMIVHGRVESVYNIFGANIENTSELYLIIKRCPRPKEGYVLDPTTYNPVYFNGSTYGVSSMGDGVITHPFAAPGIRQQALNQAVTDADKAEAKRDPLVRNPWQIVPFFSSSMRDYPGMKDTMGVDDWGNVQYGEIIRIGKVWFPGVAPRTSVKIKDLEPLTNMGEYIRCGPITVLIDNLRYGIRK